MKIYYNTSIPFVENDFLSGFGSELPAYNNARYNGHAVSTGKLCPVGWHMPTDAEWTILTTFCGGDSIAAIKLKSTSWPNYGEDPLVYATNESGFTALPNTPIADWVMSGGGDAYWWTSTENTESFIWFLSISWDYNSVFRRISSKTNGFSVRCLKD